MGVKVAISKDSDSTRRGWFLPVP